MNFRTLSVEFCLLLIFHGMLWLILNFPSMAFVIRARFSSPYTTTESIGSVTVFFRSDHKTSVYSVAVIPTTAYANFINASKLHCGLDFFTYRNLFQNEISDDFSSKSLLKLLIHSNAHIHNYRSLKKRYILELEIRFRLFASSILLEPHGIATFDLCLNYQIYFQLIYTFRHYFDSLFSQNLVVITTWLSIEIIWTIFRRFCLPLKKKIVPPVAHYLPFSSCMRSLQ